MNVSSRRHVQFTLCNRPTAERSGYDSCLVKLAYTPPPPVNLATAARRLGVAYVQVLRVWKERKELYYIIVYRKRMRKKIPLPMTDRVAPLRAISVDAAAVWP